MPFYKITLCYDGTRYSGWQLQPGRATIQGELEKALHQVTNQFIRVAGASRTDAGVHALAQVAICELAKKWDPFRLQGALNGVLPADIAVTKVQPLRRKIDPTRAASKLYHYKVWNAKVRDPLQKDRVWWVRHPLDPARLKTALTAIVGRHDFSSFAASDRSTKTTVREIKMARFIKNGNLLTFQFAAGGFLKGMVRNLVGTLIEIGRGRLAPEEMKQILEACDRRAAGPIAPACGLYLVRLVFTKR